MRALIGHTGFVGSALARHREFDAYYNSSNIEDMWGREFDEVVCAGVYARKWWANRHPRDDWAGINRLWQALNNCSIGKLTLISTVDVYANPIGVNEDSRTSTEGLGWYGTNRLVLEAYVRNRFPDALIVRLPALFGPGLKKNALHDLIHDHETHKIPRNSVYQWYPVDLLAGDLRCMSGLVNIVSPPVSMEEIRQRFFPKAKLGRASNKAPRYEVETRYPVMMLRKERVLTEMEAYLDAVRLQ